jgi:WD40 repeat protein
MTLSGYTSHVHRSSSQRSSRQWQPRQYGCVWDVRSGSCALTLSGHTKWGVESLPLLPTVGSYHWSRRSCSVLEADNVPMQAAGRVKALRLFDARVDE